MAISAAGGDPSSSAVKGNKAQKCPKAGGDLRNKAGGDLRKQARFSPQKSEDSSPTRKKPYLCASYHLIGYNKLTDTEKATIRPIKELLRIQRTNGTLLVD